MDPYAHYTPKPLHEQVPGAWNFIEPKPTGNIAADLLKDTKVRPPAPGRLTLSPEARRKLLDALTEGLLPEAAADAENTYGRGCIENPDDGDWQRLEDTLLNIIAPVRYIVGIDPAAGDPTRP